MNIDNERALEYFGELDAKKQDEYLERFWFAYQKEFAEWFRETDEYEGD